MIQKLFQLLICQQDQYLHDKNIHLKFDKYERHNKNKSNNLLLTHLIQLEKHPIDPLQYIYSKHSVEHMCVDIESLIHNQEHLRKQVLQL